MLEKLTAIIADTLSVEEDIIKEETSLKEDLDADSLDFVELVMNIEENFGVSIDEEDTAKIKTVQDILDYLKAQGVEE
ncbi:MAG: acyl carrier protein [Lachnospiraceae bacterium]|nr:acyl carrier protein [Lachnospiraceae bacterium]